MEHVQLVGLHNVQSIYCTEYGQRQINMERSIKHTSANDNSIADKIIGRRISAIDQLSFSFQTLHSNLK